MLICCCSLLIAVPVLGTSILLHIANISWPTIWRREADENYHLLISLGIFVCADLLIFIMRSIAKATDEIKTAAFVLMLLAIVQLALQHKTKTEK